MVVVFVVMAAVVVVDVLVGVVKYLQSDKIRIQRDTDKYTMQMPTQIHIQRQILVDACGCLWLAMAVCG